MNNLETKRTILRSVKSTDLNPLKQILMNENVMSYTGFKRVQTEDESLELVAKWKTDLGVWVAIHKESNDLIGWFMLKFTVSEDYPEIGFMLDQNFWGEGYATEVASMLVNYALEDLQKLKVIASVNSTNIASIRVLEKLGMKLSESIAPKGEIKYYEKYLDS